MLFVGDEASSHSGQSRTVVVAVVVAIVVVAAIIVVVVVVVFFIRRRRRLAIMANTRKFKSFCFSGAGLSQLAALFQLSSLSPRPFSPLYPPFLSPPLPVAKLPLKTS